MRFCGIAFAVALALLSAHANAQHQPPTDILSIAADEAFTWTSGTSNIVLARGPVTIKTDRVTLSAEQAVIWLTPLENGAPDAQLAEIALIGDAALSHERVVRSGEQLMVTVPVRGTVTITAETRRADDLSDDELYQQATVLREGTTQAPPSPITPPAPPPLPPPTVDTTPSPDAPAPPAAPMRTSVAVTARFGELETTLTEDERVALVLSGGVMVFYTMPGGEFVEMLADRAVLFTTLTSLREAQETDPQENVEAVYLEGDVRISRAPSNIEEPDQRLRADRVFYELTTDRAVLTDAVLHTTAVSQRERQRVPIVLRAETIRQLSANEYSAEDAELTTSSFAVPSYAVRARTAYVRQTETADPRLGTRTVFVAHHTSARMFDVPFFYFPVVGGVYTDRGLPIRSLRLGNSRGFGTSVQTEWGLFETLGRVPPRGLDVGYEVDYFAERGPAGGVNAQYRGGFITETTKEPWNFLGNFNAYAASDTGEDFLGRNRARIPVDADALPGQASHPQFRYRLLWEHQQFLPDDWQVQLRAGLVSDETFLEEWFEDEFNNGLPHDLSAYLKRQKDTEAITFLANIQPNDFVTTADRLQEGFEVERLPEIGYYRIGESFGQDRFTFHSFNTVSGLRHNISDATDADHGFRGGARPSSPGLSSPLGETGVTDDWVYRGNFRQEIGYPIMLGQFKLLPYVMGRYVGYTDSPANGSEQRLFVGTGVRLSTAFWKINDAIRSPLFDINRIRHVVEPEVHLFTSAQTVEREDVYIFDESVDAINDISAIQLALRQRWQTKRGGPGRWRSVDFLTLNLEGNFFANQPTEAQRSPADFRGLFFSSLPEASIPRNSINADAMWRVSDTMVVLGDAQWNLDEDELATTSVGLAVQRDTRLSYFVGTRYIGSAVDATLASFAANYELTTKYALAVSQSINLSERRNQVSSFTVLRRYDRFFLTVDVYYDAVNEESGVQVGLLPQGFGAGTGQLANIFGGQ